jgi:hypothetical protein
MGDSYKPIGDIAPSEVPDRLQASKVYQKAIQSAQWESTITVIVIVPPSLVLQVSNFKTDRSSHENAQESWYDQPCMTRQCETEPVKM